MKTVATLVLGLLMTACSHAVPSGTSPIGCGFAVEPPMAVVTLTNRGDRDLWLLRWNTPFERQPWFGRWLDVERDGRALDWRGPMVKRGDPAPADYLRLAPGESRSARADLSLVYALDQSGRYRAVPRLNLLDWGQGDLPWPRTRADFGATPLPCAAVDFEWR